MIGTFRKVIDIVTQHVCFIEQYLDYMLRLTKSLTDISYSHKAREYLGECGRGNIQPLKRPVDVGEHEQALGTMLLYALAHCFVRNDS